MTEEPEPEGLPAKFELLAQMRAAALGSASDQAVERQREKGKLTARERIEKLLDPGSFVELDTFVRSRPADPMPVNRPWGDAVITGHGTVDGRPVCVYSQDFTVMGGSLGEAVSQKVRKVMDLALKVSCPVVGINDSGGARIQEGVASLVAYGEIFAKTVESSGVVPQISVIMGPCAGGAVYTPALTDFVFMVKGTSHMFITGPEVTRAVTGEAPSLEELGGAMTHATKSGVAHFASDDEESCLDDVRWLLSFLPQHNLSRPSRVSTTDPPDRRDETLDRILPENPRAGYDMRSIVSRVVDDGEFLEVHEHFARNLIVGFARLDGHAVGVLGNQPLYLGGALDSDASVKGARFVRLCDNYNLPVISFSDVPGLVPGTQQEWGGIIRHGAKLVFALTEATVPRLTVVTRKAYGGAYMVSARVLNADYAIAWPGAEIAVMGADAAVSLVHRRALAEADDPQRLRDELMDEYELRHSNPYAAAERGYLDDVVQPRDTRAHLIRALTALLTKSVPAPNRKHGHIPL